MGSARGVGATCSRKALVMQSLAAQAGASWQCPLQEFGDKKTCSQHLHGGVRTSYYRIPRRLITRCQDISLTPGPRPRCNVGYGNSATRTWRVSAGPPTYVLHHVIETSPSQYYWYFWWFSCFIHLTAVTYTGRYQLHLVREVQTPHSQLYQVLHNMILYTQVSHNRLILDTRFAYKMHISLHQVKWPSCVPTSFFKFS